MGGTNGISALRVSKIAKKTNWLLFSLKVIEKALAVYF
jgi:hypothetical protein